MRLRAFALSLAAVAAAAAPAPADTLFTTPSHTTPVAVGTTASVSSGVVTISGTLSGGPLPDDTCTSATLNLTIDQNNGSGVAGTFTSGSFTGCGTVPVSGNFPWRFTVGGSGSVSGANTVFLNTTWDDVSINALGTSSGTLTDAAGAPPANGVYVRQTTVTGTGICFVLANAGALSSGVLTDVRFDGTFCLEGSPATSWSLGATAVTLPPATLYTSSAHTTRVPVGAPAAATSTGTLSWTFGGSPVNACESSALTFTLGQNTSGLVSGTVTGGSLTGCTGATTPTFPWTLTIAGDGLATGGSRVFANTTVANARFDLFGGLFSGTLTAATGIPPANGVFTTQSAGAPICFVLDRAGGLPSGLLLDGRYCLQGEPASTWSLT